jgi:branched-chain amino acid transport system ATP-binding protein
VLEVKELVSSYGRIRVLHGVDIAVHQGEIVALLGANGAGKSTLLRSISGVQPIQSGHMTFCGQLLDNEPSHRRAAIGIGHSPEGRQIFKPLTVRENLRLGAYWRKDRRIAEDEARISELFPVLAEMKDRVAAELSGGQQQMLAIGRALMGRPKMLLLDEPSLGLAPLMIDQIFEMLQRLRSNGITILLVEQNATAALSIADRGYVLERGRVAQSGGAQQLLADPAVRSAYLGSGEMREDDCTRGITRTRSG